MCLYSLSRSACLQRTKYQSKPCCILMFFSEYSNSICWYSAVPGRNLLLTCRSRSNPSTDFIAYSRSSLAAIIVGAFSCLALAFKRATVSLKKNIWKRFIKIYIWPTEKFKNLLLMDLNVFIISNISISIIHKCAIDTIIYTYQCRKINPNCRRNSECWS